MKSTLIIAVTWLALLATIVRGTRISATDKTRIENGLLVGEKISEAVQSDNFQKVVKNIGSKMAPFLGALGPIFGILFSFIPSGPSLEDKLMKRFDVLDQKFDRVDARFNEVKGLIKWENMQVKFADEEQSIRHLQEKYRQVMNAPVNAKAGYKRDFITQYESDYQGAGFKLYDAAVSNDATTYKNVFRAIMGFSQNDRKQVETFMLGYFGLVMKAMVVQMAYYKWAGYTLTGSRTDTWLDRMEKLKQEMVKLDNEVINGYRTQLSKDLDKFLNLNANLGNQAYAEKLYAKLSVKFYWRYWVVLVSKDLEGATNHWHGHACGSSMKFRKQGKNVIVASVGNTYSQFDATKANLEIDRIGQYMADKNLLPTAQYMFNQVDADVRKYCKPFAYIAMVCQSCKPDLAVKAANGHLVFKMIKSQTHARGFWGQDRFNREMNGVFFG